MRTTSLIAALFAGLVMAGPAAAQNEAPAPQPAQTDEDFTQSHLQAAQDVIDLTHSDEGFDDILPRLAEQTRGVFIRSNPALTREIEDTVMEIAIDFAKRRVELSNTMQLVWARRFSEEELNELKAFFESPVGTKFAEETPVITALSIGAARQWEERLSNEMVEATRAKLREDGLL
ncbi:DUF2059 domain-containing protein [Acuticoccus sp. M5D2P5]|uniref:DUF2059 domain-containing protein n=1 Tax=Acuticoccus kalidii TaxID=2910977 RepID=UPI001F332430|nr:DUF2059 domain-containing protein [Acuticoccus kalidii]MCF3932842.1 DUF2059 domain-containing protein [Acuticoccus kalidii]